MSKRMALPTPKKGKFLALLVLAVGLYLVITDPAGSAESLGQVRESVTVFWAAVRGDQA